MTRKYAEGKRWCSKCQEYQTQFKIAKNGGLHCPDCGYRVRMSPRNKRHRKEVK